MRRAYFDVNWLLADDGTLQGLALGYDRCGEHQRGIAPMLALLGLVMPDYPLGVEGRQAKTAPTGSLVFDQFLVKPKDQRRKRYQAAMLLLEAHAVANGRTGPYCQKEYDLGFRSEPTKHHARPEYDLAVSWSHKGFALCVRGEANIARLRELHEAFLACDVAVAVPWERAFLRGGLSFVIPSRMPAEAKATVLARDQDHLALVQAADATGIEALLEAADKRWYALAPSWFDDRKDEVIFYLNPCEQRRYDGGWFTVAELQQWARDEGPVLKEVRLDEFLKQPENYNWSYRLLEGMQAQEVYPRHHEKVVWFDDAKTIPGLRHRATRKSEALLPSGVYPFEELMARFATPLVKAAANA